MIRAVLAVVLTAALLGVSLPAIDDARHDRADSAVRTELDRFEEAATDLLEADDPTGTDGGARRLVALDIPAESWASARVETVTISASPDGTGARLGWTFDSGTRQVRHLPRVPVRTPDGEPISFRSPGRHELVLSLDGSRENPVVTVRRFTNDDGTTGAHATVAIDGNWGIDRRVRL